MSSSLLHCLAPFHFVGIGGIGMSGLAEALHVIGLPVRGSDQIASINTSRLIRSGIVVSIGHDPSNVHGASTVVLSSAIAENNPEVLEARRLGIKIIHRSEVLSALAARTDCVAVAGTHGKTTTTTLFGWAMSEAGLDPTIVTGGIMNAWGTNIRAGNGSWMVAEADESDGTFNRLHPAVAVITNIDAEHLDYYGTFCRLQTAFAAFAGSVPFWGYRILCCDCENIREIITNARLINNSSQGPLITYGLSPDADVRVEDVALEGYGTSFTVRCRDLTYGAEFDGKRFLIPLPGEHNALNCASVIAFAAASGLIDCDNLKRSFAAFTGVQRRFTRIANWNGAEIIDDYAHHPRELGCVIAAARQLTSGRVHAVFQPHRYSRFGDLWREFVNVLCEPDTLTLTPVYAAGETKIPGIDSETMAREVRQLVGKEVAVAADASAVLSRVRALAQPGDIVISMGAGSISTWIREVAQALQSDSGGNGEISRHHASG